MGRLSHHGNSCYLPVQPVLPVTECRMHDANSTFADSAQLGLHEAAMGIGMANGRLKRHLAVSHGGCMTRSLTTNTAAVHCVPQLHSSSPGCTTRYREYEAMALPSTNRTARATAAHNSDSAASPTVSGLLQTPSAQTPSAGRQNWCQRTPMPVQSCRTHLFKHRTGQQVTKSVYLALPTTATVAWLA